jgi:hypothetical protein
MANRSHPKAFQDLRLHDFHDEVTPDSGRRVDLVCTGANNQLVLSLLAVKRQHFIIGHCGAVARPLRPVMNTLWRVHRRRLAEFRCRSPDADVLALRALPTEGSPRPCCTAPLGGPGGDSQCGFAGLRAGSPMGSRRLPRYLRIGLLFEP